MLEKIKITVPKSTYEILIKDCENFNFYKSDEILNKNLFLNTLIVNYYEKFCANEENFKEKILKVINDNVDKNQNELLEQIINTIRKNENNESEKKTETINLKPTKLSEKHILFIENNLLGNNSISAFYRNLFNSYAHIPQNYRELIIFKETYDALTQSIEKDRAVCITLNNNEVIKCASVYKVESSKEELFNYVLINQKNTTMTLRLSKIKYVSLLNEKRNITDKCQMIFDRQIKYGVQYPFYTFYDEPVIVKMTDRGKDLFKRIYLYRPTPDKIEGNLYYFNCSHNQVMHYFKRFGYDAMIISPIELAESMKKYYYLASIKYGEKIAKLKNQ